MDIAGNGLCIIADQYFDDFPSIRHMSNKHEKRPYYLAIRGVDGIIWMVPLSSQVEKYKRKIEADEAKYGDCMFYYLAKVKGRESAFLVGNAIPVTENYIKKPFTVRGIPFVMQNKEDIRKIQSKLKRYLLMTRQGRMRPAVDILGIERVLLNRLQNNEYLI